MEQQDGEKAFRDPESAAASRKARRAARGDQDPAEWTSVDPEVLSAAIAAVGEHGGALRFGYTRDGGAYSVGVYGHGEPYTIYLRPSDDVEGWLLRLIEDVWEFGPTRGARRQRRALQGDADRPAGAKLKPDRHGRRQTFK